MAANVTDVSIVLDTLTSSSATTQSISIAFASDRVDNSTSSQQTIMRSSLIRLATATSAGAGSALRPPPVALLPPIYLYRRLLRAHRTKLLPDERILGDQYIKAEFRAHRNVENPMHIVGFLTEWQLYAQALEGDDWKGAKMDKAKVDKMSDEQIGQLYELMQAIQKRAEFEVDEEIKGNRNN